MDLARYEMELIQQDPELVLYRAHPSGRRPPLLVLGPASSQPGAATLARLAHEQGLASALDPAWAVQPLGLARHRGRAALLLADPGGTPLEQLLARPLALTQALTLAAALAAVLAQVHGGGLIHKDVKPANVLVTADGSVRLTGFGLASRLPRERQGPSPPQVIAGTLAYMAPEQTGRMNRSIDTRSDLYALGVTLYQMLTATLPFAAADPLEWIHCHIARPPPPPSTRVENLPGPLEAIVLRLLAKAPEERYQTAAGLAHDLRLCLAQWQAHGRIEPFALGAHDVPDRLLIPETLYGRQAEAAALLAAFDRVVASGATELVLVAGYSGIGKSALVHELHRALVPSRGLFASGKFDQYQRDIPYATLAQAFQGLIRQVLSAPDPELARWRAALQEGLGANAELMVGLIPELALVIGEPPPAPDVAPQDRQNRFHLVFRRFIGVFARPEHPLVLFLDDLQWLDAASLALLERLATEPELGHLLLIGAYRSNEVGPAHPLTGVLERVRAAARVSEISLGALTSGDVEQLLADALHAGLGQVRPLAALVLAKTAGNPFFVIQFVTALADEGLLAFDPEARAWRWDVEGIAAKSITDNVVDLMAGRLARLAPSTLAVLRHLACLGASAPAARLGLLAGLREEEIHAALWPVVRTGLVLRQGDVYAFAHDRVQEAAYGLVPEAERAGAHLTIGRLLLAATAPAEREANIFEIVSQLNRGAGLITAPAERDEVAGLNLLAGRRAKASTAYAAALEYFGTGRALLGETGWARQHRLTFDLELNQAECLFLTGNLAAAEEHLTRLQAKAADTFELAGVAWIVIPLFPSIGRTDRAIEVGLSFLQRVGIGWSPHPTDEEVAQEYQAMWRRIAERPIEALVDLPLMSDPGHQATMDVLAAMLHPAPFSDQNLFALVVGRMVNLSLAHGHCDASAFACSLLGHVFGQRFGERQAGLRFGQLAFDLVETRGLTRFKARVYSHFAGSVVPWTRPLRDSIPLLRRAVEAAIEAGDPLYTAWTSRRRVANLVACGAPLAEVQREAQSSLEAAQKASFDPLVDITSVQLALVLGLRGLTPGFGPLSHAAFDEDDFERSLTSDTPHSYAAWRYWIYKLQARFLAGDVPAALHAARQAQENPLALPGALETAECHFYAALALAASCTSLPPAARPEPLAALAAHHEQLALWAQDCPENFRDRAALVAAEIARLEGRHDEAKHLYQEAAQAAQEQGFVHNEALAHELAARFHHARGARSAGDACLHSARACYARWGADGKVRQLEQTYPQLRRPPAPLQAESTISLPAEHLDLATIVRVSQALSGEIDLKSLIHTLMKIVLEHSGGERAVLILPHANSLRVEAEAIATRNTIEVRLHKAPVTFSDLPGSVLRYVLRTRNMVLLDDAAEPGPYAQDAYLRGGRCRSLVCLPLTKLNALAGVMYIESTSSTRVFTPARTEVLLLIASQAAISLENARHFADLQRTKANLEEAQRLTHTGSFTFDTLTYELFWSDEIYRIYQLDPKNGITLEEVVPRVVPEDRHLLQAFIDGIPHDGEPHILEHRILVPDGAVKTLRIIAHSEQDETGNVVLVGTAIDITAARAAEEQLQASMTNMRKLASLIENSTDCIGYAQSPEKVEYVNAAWRRLTGLDPDEDVSGYRMSDFLTEEDYQYFLEQILPVLMRNGHWEGERNLRHLRTGALIPVHQTIFFITHPQTGRRTAIATICRDITERRRMDADLRASLAEKEALLKEVHHRVKNNLQLISSLLSLQAGRSRDPAEAERFTESRNRVRSMALVHENLYRTGDFASVSMASHVEALCAQLFRAYRLQGQRVDLVTDVEDIELDLDQAVCVGLIINELVSNALKHAFPDGRAGDVQVSLKRLSGGRCALTVRDDGVGLPPGHEGGPAETLGLQLVQDLTQQLHATLTITRQNGTAFIVAFDAAAKPGPLS